MKPQSEKTKLSSAKSYGLGVLILILSTFIAIGLQYILDYIAISLFGFGSLEWVDIVYSLFSFLGLPALITIFSVFVVSMVFRTSLAKAQNITKVLFGSSILPVIFIALSIAYELRRYHNTHDPLGSMPEGGVFL